MDGTEATERAAYRTLTFELVGVAPGKRILDLGCGAGDDVFAMARHVGEHGEVVGVDQNAALIAQAQKRAEATDLPVRFAAARVTELPFPPGSFDGARAAHLFQYLSDPEAALAELVRVVRPGAAVVAADPDYGSAVLDVDDRAVAHKVQAFLCAQLPNPWSGRRLKAMFGRSALSDILVHVDYRPFTLADLKAARLPQALETMVQQRLLTRDQADRFLQELEERSAAGLFFGGLSFFVVAGHKSTAKK